MGKSRNSHSQAVYQAFFLEIYCLWQSPGGSPTIVPFYW